MKISLIRKERGRVYKSADIVRALFGFKLDHDEERAPHLKGPECEGLFISISDTVNYWACCIEPHRVGLDMEERSRVVKPRIARKLHKDEQEYLSALSEGGSEWQEEFLSVWTRKEAWSKYKGVGLSLDFSSFYVLDGSLEGVPVASFTYRNLVFGIAGDAKATVQRAEYDAPFRKNALDYAAGLLDARAYSSAELKKKLESRGYAAEEIAEALEKLKDYGYVNDEEYAENMVRRGSEQGKSSRRVKAELKLKGIDPDAAEEAAEELKEGDFARALKEAEKILEKSGGLPYASREDDIGSTEEARERVREAYAKRQKIYGKISRRLAALGYEASVIYSVLEEIGR